MQTVSAAFTAEEHDSVRRIAQNTQISWHKQSTLGNRTFTISTSLIGGNDIIGINPGAVGSPGNYKYFDESSYVTSLSWERGLNLPAGGLSKALAEVQLDNTSGRFTPRFMGGNSELYTAQALRAPLIINAGFNVGGVDQVIPEFAGIITDQPEVDMKNRQVRIKGSDYIDYFQNKYLDRAVMFTAQRTDQVMTTLLGTLGMNTAQYDLDTGINIIPFGMFDVGSRFSDIFHKLAEAENGHFYQDESGIFKFENRQHWDISPYTNVQRVITTAQVLQSSTPSTDHLINVVEINGVIRQKQPLQTIYTLPPLTTIAVPANTSVEQFFEFQDPVLALTDPTSSGSNSYYVANSAADASGTDVTSSISVRNVGTFAQSVKYRFTNSSLTTTAYIIAFVLAGRVAKQTGNFYYREKDDSSVTAYQERVLTIDNEYIQDQTWAASYSRMILNDFSGVENLQIITIRAVPELQLGDLISWQGRYWRIFDIKSTLDPSAGYIQELTLVQRAAITYFRIGISTIGSDQIAP